MIKPLKIGVATGEMCQNRVMFKQLFQAKSFSFCQIDTARVGGVNENLAIYFMAKKFGGLRQVFCFCELLVGDKTN